MKKSIDILVYKMFYNNSFCEEVLNYSQNSLILIFDFDKITIYHKPAEVAFKKSVLHFLRPKNKKLAQALLPFIFFADMAKLVALFSYICFIFRPKVCWIENSYAAVIVGVMRRMGFCSKSIYLPGDWLVSKHHKKLLSRLANNFLFPIIDYLACKLNDRVLDLTQEISRAREVFWGKSISKDIGRYYYNLKMLSSEASALDFRRHICFIGQMRENSGLDLVIRSLGRIRQKENLFLSIIGPKTMNYEYLNALVRHCRMEPYVFFHGFVESERFNDILSNCFCGINILTLKDSYSSFTIPGKLLNYIQYLLPVIVTEGSGSFVDTVKENNLGLVIEASEEAFCDAALNIYNNQKKIRYNIIKYIQNQRKVSLKEMIGT